MSIECWSQVVLDQTSNRARRRTPRSLQSDCRYNMVGSNWHRARRRHVALSEKTLRTRVFTSQTSYTTGVPGKSFCTFGGLAVLHFSFTRCTCMSRAGSEGQVSSSITGSSKCAFYLFRGDNVLICASGDVLSIHTLYHCRLHCLLFAR